MMTGFSPFFRHCVLSLAFAAQVFAISDENANGLSDVWERLFDSGQLFSSSNPSHASTADPDGDSWTNATEAIAGTNPFVS